MSSDKLPYKIEWSAIATFIGIIILFSSAIIVTLIIPAYVDPTWISPSSAYQKQMYEVVDPNMYISSTVSGGQELQFVYHIRRGYTLTAFQESETVRIVAPPALEKYITKHGDKTLKLSSDLLLLRRPEKNAGFDAVAAADALQKKLQTENKGEKVNYVILELYAPDGDEGFAVASNEGNLENWVDSDFVILDEEKRQDWHSDPGVIYVYDPIVYRVSRFKFGDREGWRYNPNGQTITSLDELLNHDLGFHSRKELIQDGEDIYRIEGCWYCHTDQTRTLVQDVVLNGSDSYPAPPSSPQEYIYQHVTFPGTRRIGPDLSRVGVKRPIRDWHKGHFWSPKTASKGSIMPAFHHFFDNDPRGTSKGQVGIPNYKFEAIFQYLMTKGTRITPPTEAWWLGKDPVHTKEIIEGRRR
ncbi:MAG: cbb3-type cytochrome c oxidase subunit II [Chlamydiales bacterium]|nr:cbb3-type cytochrome c oxidase subunit II [Chlamydiia bacterium]MCP5507460.1 cbb3-type cytochrome c oxidase subunit II [Chlamydiales bacterium]